MRGPGMARGCERALVLALVLLGGTCVVAQGGGDACGLGQVFPIEYDGATLVGCEKFEGQNWCQREDGTFFVCPTLTVSESTQGGDDSPVRQLVSSPGQQVIVSEILVINELFVDEDGETSDWLELHNREETTVNMQGWSLTDDRNEPRKWSFPSISLDPGQYTIIFASGKDRASDEAVHTNFRMKSDGEYLGLVRPDGSVSTAIISEYPRQIPNVPYGIPNYPSGSQFTLLNKPTPGEPNAGALESGPFVSAVQLQSEANMPPAGQNLAVNAIVSQHLAPVESVSLVYVVMYGAEVTVPMTKTGTTGFAASIPASAFAAGNMVRWYVKTVDTEGNTARDPPFVTDDWPQYYGTVIADSSLESSLPTLHWFASDPSAAISADGSRGSLFFRKKFYDNVFTRRRGVTSLSWPKPKIKFDFKGRVFKYDKKKTVEEFNLQSFYDEPGEDSYLRETSAFQIMREAGVPASDSFHLRVNQNGEYYGLFAFVEQVEDGFLEKYGYSVQGPLFKAIHGELSNLRWDVRKDDLKFAYKKGNRKEIDDWQLLHDFTQGLGGGGPIPRSKYIFDHLDLPQIINYMAVSNMLLNQDRCTKNFYLYRNPSNARWSVFPWDLEGSFGISNGIGGEPAPDYCVLACEQWNSPLYCDSSHPQDIPALANIDIKTGRRLMQTTAIPTAATTQVNPYRIPSFVEYDRDQTLGPSPTGAAGTFNHIEDAILDWPITRQMYLRRLRTLVDQFMSGKVQNILKSMWSSIQSEAYTDNSKWSVTPDPDKGLEQLLTEQIPKRLEQLLVKYGPGGFGLVPPAQPPAPPMLITQATSSFVRIENLNSYAVDMSNWIISGDTYYKFPPGTVVASGSSLLLTPDIKGFYYRQISPKGGEGLFVLGPVPAITGGSFTIVTDLGARV